MIANPRSSLGNPDSVLNQTAIPIKCGRIVDIAPLNLESTSTWLMLAEDGGLFRLEADSGESELVGRAVAKAP